MSDAQGKGRAPDQESAAENVDAKNDSAVRDKMQGSFHGYVRAYVAAGLCLIPIKAHMAHPPHAKTETSDQVETPSVTDSGEEVFDL